MSNSDWNCPDADEHGFVTFELLQKRAAGVSREQFVRAFPVPALRVVYRDGNISAGIEGESVLDPHDRGIQLMTVSIRSTSILSYLGRVAFIAKRPGNPFAHLISIGRSANNDITVAVDSVSKVHGYFVYGDSGETFPGRPDLASVEPGWSFIDHGSTNGSSIDDADLVSGRRYSQRDGNVLRLGFEVTLEFMSPETLYQSACAQR